MGTRRTPLTRRRPARARAHLGWRPRWGIGAAMDAVVSFARAEGAGGDLRDVVLAQIAQYEAGRAPAPVVPLRR